METVYEIRGFTRRQTISFTVLVLVGLYGLWELWNGFQGDTTALIFGVVFIGGMGWGLRQVLADGRDQVAHMEQAPDGALTLTLWRPLKALVLTAPPGDLTDWRYHITVTTRGLKRPFLHARAPGYPRELAFELRPDVTITDALRTLAGSALDDHAPAGRDG